MITSLHFQVSKEIFTYIVFDIIFSSVNLLLAKWCLFVCFLISVCILIFSIIHLIGVLRLVSWLLCDGNADTFILVISFLFSFYSSHKMLFVNLKISNSTSMKHFLSPYQSLCSSHHSIRGADQIKFLLYVIVCC